MVELVVVILMIAVSVAIRSAKDAKEQQFRDEILRQSKQQNEEVHQNYYTSYIKQEIKCPQLEPSPIQCQLKTPKKNESNIREKSNCAEKEAANYSKVIDDSRFGITFDDYWSSLNEGNDINTEKNNYCKFRNGDYCTKYDFLCGPLACNYECSWKERRLSNFKINTYQEKAVEDIMYENRLTMFGEYYYDRYRFNKENYQDMLDFYEYMIEHIEWD